MIDYAGVTLAGCKEPVSRSIQAYVRRHSAQSESRVFGRDILVSCDLGALANGVAGHALDYDDVSWTTIGHPTVTVAPAVFASGEVRHAPGQEILRAYAVGVEIQNKIAALAMPDASSNGWHTTSVFGPFGAAVASALINTLEYEPFISALGIAASMAGGIRANFGTMTKAYHAGMTAFNGITAVSLARLGLTAAEDAIEAQDGFVQVFSGKKPKKCALRFGETWDIITPGLVFKRYPCCSGTHPAVDCMMEILEETPFSADQVESIHVGVSLPGLKELVCHSPTTPTEARFSMEHALAAAIVYRKIGLSEFTSESVNDPGIREIIPKITMEIDPQLAKLGFIGRAPAKLRIALKDGRLLKGRCDLAKGNPEKPLNDEELSAKFFECASKVFEPDRSQRVFDALLSIEKVEDINSITRLLQ